MPEQNTNELLPHGYDSIRAEIVALLSAARAASARSVNALMTATYWEVGRRIVEFEQRGAERAEYGEAIIRQLAGDLTRQFGRGFGAVNLSQMRRFFLEWPPERIFQTASEKSPSLADLGSKFALPWSAYVRLLSVKSSNARAFYETEALRSGLVSPTTGSPDLQPVLRTGGALAE
jgi:hypothetical protein